MGIQGMRGGAAGNAGYLRRREHMCQGEGEAGTSTGDDGTSSTVSAQDSSKPRCPRVTVRLCMYSVHASSSPRHSTAPTVESGKKAREIYSQSHCLRWRFVYRTVMMQSPPAIWLALM